MDLELLIKLVGGASALIIAWRTIDRRASRKREIENVKLTAEFYNELPEGFHQKEIIKQFLEKEIYRIYHPESIEESERNSDILYGLLWGVVLLASTIILGFYYHSEWAVLTFFVCWSVFHSTFADIKKAYESSKDTEKDA